MSWNGNDLFNSTLMGGMPSGADPHQYLTTDGNGKPHWEDKLAYEASTEEVILPDTKVTNVFYSQVFVPCPNAPNVKIGDTGTFYIDGEAYPYVAVAHTGTSGPFVDVKLDLDGKGDLIGFYGNQLMFYNIMLTPPGGSAIISIVKNSTTIKTFDTDLMGKNAEANKVLVTDENGEAVWSDSLPSGSGGGGGVMYIAGTDSLIVPAYADDALTTMLSYDQAKEIIQKPFAVRMTLEGTPGAMYPAMAFGDDSLKKVNMVVITPEAGAATGMTLTFSDTPEG